MEPIDRIQFLFDRWLEKKITDPEFEELLVWMHGLDEEQLKALSERNISLWEQAKKDELLQPAVDWDSMLATVTSTEELEVPSENKEPVLYPRRKWMRWVAAAAFLVIAIPLGYYLVHRHEKTPAANSVVATRSPETVLPNINSTVLTTSNGKRINLDSLAGGKLAAEGESGVNKLGQGKISYAANSDDDIPVEYHTIAVPRGGRPYQITLSDGTSIWLNVASSIRYPSVFRGSSRDVELTGEGYFEVVKDRTKPFHVKYNNMTVEVLGTHFDVMTYDDEKNVETTLLEGLVKVTVAENKTGVMLHPGEAGVLLRANNRLTVKPANTALATAWVKGYFQFDKADLPSILRQVSRNYDLQIKYNNPATTDLFSGKIERNLPLSSIVKVLEEGNIKVRIEGDTLVVL